MKLTNKVALITGGTHGIGAAAVEGLVKQGVTVSIVARNIENTDMEIKLKEIGAKYHFISADLSREEENNRVVEETYKKWGRIDILIHSAGTAAPGGLGKETRDVWYKAFDIHVHAVFHLCNAAYQHMKESGEGALVLISSVAGLRGVKGALPYAVVKGALPQFTKALTFELSDDNIRVNCVSPGIIRTRFQDYLTPEQVDNNIKNRIPVHREGSPQDVVDAILMLIQNEFITGENLVIDGGMSMRIV